MCAEVPGDNAEILFNKQLCQASPFLPSMSDADCEAMTMTTIVGSHCNYVSRCYYYGVSCGPGHEDHSNGCGMMNMSYLSDWQALICQVRATTRSANSTHRRRS